MNSKYNKTQYENATFNRTTRNNKKMINREELNSLVTEVMVGFIVLIILYFIF